MRPKTVLRSNLGSSKAGRRAQTTKDLNKQAQRQARKPLWILSEAKLSGRRKKSKEEREGGKEGEKNVCCYGFLILSFIISLPHAPFCESVS